MCLRKIENVYREKKKTIEHLSLLLFPRMDEDEKVFTQQTQWFLSIKFRIDHAFQSPKPSAIGNRFEPLETAGHEPLASVLWTRRLSSSPWSTELEHRHTWTSKLRLLVWSHAMCVLVMALTTDHCQDCLPPTTFSPNGLSRAQVTEGEKQLSPCSFLMGFPVLPTMVSSLSPSSSLSWRSMDSRISPALRKCSTTELNL